MRNGTILYYHTDHLGGTNVVTDANGEVKELIEYEPFGNFARHDKYGDDSETAMFYFTGKQRDDETGLYYYGARYYDPALGRFLTADTIVQNSQNNPQTLNRYAYCGNNPIIRIDPTGQFWFIPALVAAFKAVAAYAVAHPIIFGAAVGGLQGGISAAINGENIGLGIGVGVIAGGLAGGLGAMGPTTFSSNFLMNTTYHGLKGASVGALIGGISATAYGERFEFGAKGGAVTGGIFGTLRGITTSEQFSNFVEGNGFVNHEEAAIKAEMATKNISYEEAVKLIEPKLQMFKATDAINKALSVKLIGTLSAAVFGTTIGGVVSDWDSNWMAGGAIIGGALGYLTSGTRISVSFSGEGWGEESTGRLVIATNSRIYGLPLASATGGATWENGQSTGVFGPNFHWFRNIDIPNASHTPLF